jgi:L-iditol 2-dehydrogenase
MGTDAALRADEDVESALRSLNDGRLADVVIVTAGSIRAMEQGMALAGEGATVLLFAPSSPTEALPIRPHRLLFSEITVVSSYSCAPAETRQALRWIELGRIQVDALVTHTFDLSEVGEAMRLAARAGESLKIVITP